VRHHIHRTSPKGEPFVGRCFLCGKAGLKIGDSNDDCENERGLTEEEALLEGITGKRAKSNV